MGDRGKAETLKAETLKSEIGVGDGVTSFGFASFTADFLAPFFALLPRSRTLSEFPLPMSALAAW